MPPEELEPRHGIILLGPARLEVNAPGHVDELGTLQTGKLQTLLNAAQPIGRPGESWWRRDDAGDLVPPVVWYRFEAEYCDGSREPGRLFTDGTGELNHRWFFTDPEKIKEMGPGFAADTTEVPDASRITPEPVPPGLRAGHDISIKVHLDSGGPAIADIRSELHEIRTNEHHVRDDELSSEVVIELKRRNEIPNRDFVLSWQQTADTISEATFSHTRGEQVSEENPGFFTMILQPPDRVEDVKVPSRELVFVMDTSGSMRGFPIEKSKEVMMRALDAMRPGDTFNVITFAGRTEILWPEPKPATAENRAEAQRLVEEQSGGGGTQMMQAVEAALVQTPAADGEERPMRIVVFLTDGYVGNDQAIIGAIRRNAATTRVFAFGSGNAVNRYLLDGMARAGRGETEYVLLNSKAGEAVDRFTRRIETPVLTDIDVTFDGVEITELQPGRLPDIFSARPIVLHGRYASAGEGTMTIRGTTGAGPYQRTVDLTLPEETPDHAVIATLWAREKVSSLTDDNLEALQVGRFPQDLRQQVIALGIEFHLMTPFTSFVAVEKSRVTLGGRPVLVAVPVEMPEGVSYEGIFGEGADHVESILAQLSGHSDQPRAGLTGFDRSVRSLHGPGRRPPPRRRYAVAPSGGVPAQAALRTGPAQRGGRVNPGPGAGGGGGGFGGGAGGGNIFDEPGEDPERLSSEAKLQDVIDTIVSMLHPDAWEVNGGDLVTMIDHESDDIRIRALVDSPEAEIIVRQALTLASKLAQHAPEASRLGDGQPFTPMPADEDVARRLSETSISVNGETISLQQLGQLVRDTTGLPVYMDWDALALDRVEPDSQVTLPDGEMSVKEFLAEALAKVGHDGRVLENTVEYGALVMTSRDGASRRTLIELYEVGDLLSLLEDDRRAQRGMARSILDLIAEVVTPESWDVNGGETGSMDVLETVLVVRALPEHHEQVVGVLSDLRGLLLRGTDQLDERIRRAQRRARLTAVVDARLHVFVEDLAPPAETAEGGSGARRPVEGVEQDGRLLVSVLVQDVAAETRDRLQDAGLEVHAELPDRSFVIGRVAPERIEELAMLDAVRRVELTTPEAVRFE